MKNCPCKGPEAEGRVAEAGVDGYNHPALGSGESVAPAPSPQAQLPPL